MEVNHWPETRYVSCSVPRENGDHDVMIYQWRKSRWALRTTMKNVSPNSRSLDIANSKPQTAKWGLRIAGHFNAPAVVKTLLSNQLNEILIEAVRRCTARTRSEKTFHNTRGGRRSKGRGVSFPLHIECQKRPECQRQPGGPPNKRPVWKWAGVPRESEQDRPVKWHALHQFHTLTRVRWLIVLGTVRNETIMIEWYV